MIFGVAYKSACRIITFIICVCDIALHVMLATVHFTVCFTEVVIGVIPRVACKCAYFIFTGIVCIRDIALFAMCTAVCGAVCLAGVIKDMITIFASGDLALAVGASACSRIVCKFVAVLAG